MTKEEIKTAIQTTACDLVKKHGIPPGQACKIAARSVLRAAGMPIPAGLSAAAPATTSTPPDFLSQVSAAGDNPEIVAARGAVSKWSWVVPVGGVIWSMFQKVRELRTPTSAAIVRVGGRR